MPAWLELVSNPAIGYGPPVFGRLPETTGASTIKLTGTVTARNSGTGPGSWQLRCQLLNSRDGAAIITMGPWSFQLKPGQTFTTAFDSGLLPWAWEIEPDINWLLNPNNKIFLTAEWTWSGSTSGSLMHPNIVELPKGTPNLEVTVTFA